MDVHAENMVEYLDEQMQPRSEERFFVEGDADLQPVRQPRAAWVADPGRRGFDVELREAGDLSDRKSVV